MTRDMSSSENSSARADRDAAGDLRYWVSLTRIAGLGPKKFETLASSFESMEAVWHADIRELVDAGLDRGAAQSIAEARPSIDPDEEMEKLERAGVKAISRISPEYPTAMGETFDPPAVLFVRGEIRDADERCVSHARFVGAPWAERSGRRDTGRGRRPSTQTRKLAAKVSRSSS